jgi:hypothetical protein
MKRGQLTQGGSSRNGIPPQDRPVTAQQQQISREQKKIKQEKNNNRSISRTTNQGVDGRPPNLGNSEQDIMYAMTQFLKGNTPSPPKSPIKTTGVVFKGGEFMGYSALSLGSRHVIALVCFYVQYGFEFVFFIWEKQISGDKVQSWFTQIMILDNVSSHLYHFQPSSENGTELLQLLIDRRLPITSNTKISLNGTTPDPIEWYHHFATGKLAVENSAFIEDGLRLSLLVVTTMSFPSPVTIEGIKLPAESPLTVSMTLIYVRGITTPTHSTEPKLLNWLVVFPELMAV